jgi:hypothetical protein
MLRIVSTQCLKSFWVYVCHAYIDIISKTKQYNKELNVYLMYNYHYHYNFPNLIKPTYWIAIGRRVWRYQRGNQNSYIEEEQKTQWPKDTQGAIIIRISKNRQHNGQKKKYNFKDKQRSAKHTYKTKDRVTRTPLVGFVLLDL